MNAAPRALHLLAGSEADFDSQLAQSVPPARCYEISVTLPNGTRAYALRRGGTSAQHAEQAMVAAGLGAVVRVRPLPHPYTTFQVKPL